MLGVSTAGSKEDIARRIINKKPELEEAVDLFSGLEVIANKPHRPKLELTPDILTGAKSKLTQADVEGILPIGRAPSIPTPTPTKPMGFLAELKAGKKLKKSETSGLLDTSAQEAAEAIVRLDRENVARASLRRSTSSRKTKGYGAETVDDMLDELTHRGIQIPEKEKDKKTGKELTVGYIQTLYELMKKSD